MHQSQGPSSLLRFVILAVDLHQELVAVLVMLAVEALTGSLMLQHYL